MFMMTGYKHGLYDSVINTKSTVLMDENSFMFNKHFPERILTALLLVYVKCNVKSKH